MGFVSRIVFTVVMVTDSSTSVSSIAIGEETLQKDKHAISTRSHAQEI